MNAGIRAVVWTSTIALVIVAIFALGIQASQEPAEAAVQTQTRCVDVDNLGLSLGIENLLKLEAGRECLYLSVPVVRTTTRVQVPGDTVTRLLPQPTRTVRLPGPTETVTVRAGSIPAPTVTVTVRPEPRAPAPRPARSAAPKPTSVPTVRSTTTASPSEVTKSASPSPGNSMVVPDRQIKTETIVKTVGRGLLATLALIALLLVAMWLAYGWGVRDNERKETSFMKSLLRRKH